MKILLVQAPYWIRSYPSISQAALSAFVKRHGFEAQVMDLSTSYFLSSSGRDRECFSRELQGRWDSPAFVDSFFAQRREETERYLRSIASNGSGLVGFSVFNSTLLASLWMARRLKALDPGLRVVFGGIGCWEGDYGSILKEPAVDYIVRGEGELPLLDLARQLDKKGRVDHCPGVVLKDEGRQIDCGEREPIADLDELPFPDFSDFQLDAYEKNNTLPLSASRGCVRSCSFCSDVVFWKGFRYMSGRRIFDEMRHQVEFTGWRSAHFEFCDLVINGNMRGLRDLVEVILRSKRQGDQAFKDVTWNGQAIVHPGMTEDFARDLRQAGCDGLVFGVESGSQSVLKRINKGYPIQWADDVLRNCSKAGICVTANFMFGLPGETEGDFEQTLELLKRNREHLYSVNPSEGLASFGVYSYGYQHPEELGLESPVQPYSWISKDGKNTVEVRRDRYRRFCELADSLGLKMEADYKKILREWEKAGANLVAGTA